MPFKNPELQRTFSAWSNMRQRCNDPKNKNYDRYGGRGITVCVEWQKSYRQFKADMGIKPVGMTLDRIDNDGPYSRENCRWISHTENNRNKTIPAQQLTIDGLTLYTRDWSAVSGVERRTIRRRLRMGWPVDAAVFTPKTPRDARSKRNPYTINQKG